MNPVCSLEEFVAFIRENQGISLKKAIAESSLLESDLGITGDDGVELLQAIQERYSISFIGSDGTVREAFGLAEDQFLFGSEGFNLFSRVNVKPITVGELFGVTCRAYEKKHGA
ncbi:MAG TPA: hypothetical protein VF530_22125 [Planctomycetota bacterium]